MVAPPIAERVAAVIPVFRARYLAHALASAFAQSRPPDEVIVVDDGSPDGDQIDAAVATHAPRVTLVRQSNQGAGAARNRALRETSAPIVAFLDADDQWLPHFLLHQLNALARRPALDLVYSDALFIGDTALAGRTFMSMCPSSGPVTFERLLAQDCTVMLSAVVARRAAIEAVGGFDESLRRGQDFDLWLRMARQGASMDYQRQVLALRRLHAANLSGTPLEEIERPIRVLEKALTTMGLSPHERRIATERLRALEAQAARERGKDLLRRGDIHAARSAFVHASRDLRTWKLHAALLGLRVAPQLVRRLYLSRLESAVSSPR
jgi:glycosyltransferase involved in cell wall biosynthesis